VHSSIALLNPTHQPAPVQLAVYCGAGLAGTAEVTVAPATHRLVPLAALTHQQGTCGLAITSTRAVVPQLITDRDGLDGDTVLGSAGLGTRWYLAEGYTGLTFHETVSLLNPSGAGAAQVHLQLLPLGGRAARTVDVSVPPQTNRVVDVNALLPHQSLSIVADSDRPVAVERTLTFSTGPHGSGYGLTMRRGINTAATSWLFAEGATTNGFETFLTILDPGGTPAVVTARFYGASGAALATRTYRVAARSRATVRLNDFLHASAIASVVTSDQPIVVERPEYFGSPNGVRVAGSVVFGANGAGGRWTFPGGQTGAHNSEFLLLYNPSLLAVPVDVTLYGSAGQSRTKRITVAPTARFTLDMSQTFPGLSDLHGTILQAANAQGIVAEQTVFAPDHSTLRSTQGLAQ
jgi:hypothetical protein